jgi:sodium-coupled neutral amino acid transporter 9
VPIGAKETVTESQKIPSWMTIFSIWNTMIGSGVMALPWAFHHAGIVLGSIICFVSFLFSV